MRKISMALNASPHKQMRRKRMALMTTPFQNLQAVRTLSHPPSLEMKKWNKET
jgi:hypothetical protein